MNLLQFVGLMVIGIVVYGLLTLGIGYVIGSEEDDGAMLVIFAYSIGLILFLIMLGAWFYGLPSPLNPQ